jgi:PAS domain S-box-containing protein
MGVVEPLPDGDILHHDDNRAACEFFGVPPDGTRLRRSSELGASPETVATWLARYKASEETGVPNRFEHGFDTPGGRRWLAVTVAPLGVAASGRTRFCYVAEDVTDRRGVEDDLRESEARFRSVVEALPGHLWTATPDGDIDYASPWMSEYTGLPTEILYGSAWHDVVHPEDLAEARGRWSRSLATGERYSAEFRIRGKDGKLRWFLNQAVSRRDAGGRVLKWFGYSTDIDDMRAAQEALKAQARVTKTITDNATLALFIMDEHQQCTFMNPAAESLTGFELDEVRGRALHDVIHHTRPDGRPYPLEECPIDQAFPTDNQEQGEETFVHKDGHFYPVAFTASPIRGDDRVLGTIIEVRDITEEKRARDDRERLFREAEEGRRILQALMDHIPEGITIASAPDVSIRMVSRFGQRLVSRPAEAITGIPSNYHPERWSIFHADGVTPAKPEELPLTRATLVGELVTDEEWTLLQPDGDRVPILCNAAPIRDEAGAIIGGVIAWRDITERKKAEAERERLLVAAEAARVEAEHANRMKDEFLATLSHELRTPLNAIVGWTKILRSSNVDDEDRAEGLEVIDRNARAQAQLIEDLLDISRIISGKLVLDVQRVNLTEVIEGALDAVAPAAQGKGVRITKVLDSLAGPVSGDPARLQQVVWNLLTNAVKFTARGGQVQVLLERVNSHVEISVIDTGQGIPPEFLPHVFERFRQADGSSTRRHGGLGLGLSIVRQLVEMHGGSVRAKSPGEGQGSTFVVMLPITVVHPEQPGKVRPKDPERRQGDDPCGDHHLSGLRVLVVDDEPDARNLMTRVLEDCGAEVKAAGSAAEALDLLGGFKPDILVSDVGMPEQDGYDLMRQVRRRLSAKELPAAALTAFARSEDRMRAMRAGFQVHVAKPVDPEELVAVVATLAARTGGES